MAIISLTLYRLKKITDLCNETDELIKEIDGMVYKDDREVLMFPDIGVKFRELLSKKQ